MSRAMTAHEREAKASLEKTLGIGDGRVSLMAALTMADLRLRRLEDELADMTKFAEIAIKEVKHSGLKECPKCKLDRELGMLPRWKKILAQGDPESERCMRLAHLFNSCPERKGNVI